MIFVAGFTLAFYIMQQLGMMLGFGAEMVLLFTYLVGRRAGIINQTEDSIAHGIYRILMFSLFFIIISGLGITAIHLASHQADIFLSPSYVVKWILILIATLLAFLLRGFRIWNSFLEGFSGANWGALFLLHIFAPITTYLVLGRLYGEFIFMFLVLWYGIIFVLRLKPLVLQKELPSSHPLPQKPPETKFSFKDLFSSIITFKKAISIAPKRPVAEIVPPMPVQPQPIIFSPERTTQLSPIHVMPQSEEELKKDNEENGIKEV